MTASAASPAATSRGRPSTTASAGVRPRLGRHVGAELRLRAPRSGHTGADEHRPPEALDTGPLASGPHSLCVDAVGASARSGRRR